RDAPSLPPFPTRRSSDLEAVAVGSAQRQVPRDVQSARRSLELTRAGATLTHDQRSLLLVPQEEPNPTARRRRVARGSMNCLLPLDRKSTRLNSSHVSISY